MIAGEICKQYDTQSSHVSLFTAQPCTCCLPDARGGAV